MHVRRGVLGWGVFLILAGAIPLLVRAGVLTDEQVGDLWTLWPMILIGLGVGLLLARTRFSFIGGLIVAATFGLIVGGLLSGGVSSSAGACGSSEGASAFPDQVGTFPGASATVDVELDCGDVSITAAPGAGWTVSGEAREGQGPQVGSTTDRLEVDTTNGGGLFGIFSTRSNWRIAIPADPIVDLELDANAGTAAIDLAGAHVGQVSIGLNAGSTTIDLSAVAAVRELEVELNAGSAGITFPNLSMTGTIEANAGSVRLCVPAGVGLRIETGGSIAASYDFHDLVEDGSVWTTLGYAEAPVRIDLRTDGTAASFTLDPEGGCDG